MLSADGHIDPPSSSLNQIKAKSDGRSSAERIGSQQLDTIDFVASTPTPNFSIRDYVCKSRSNKIGACWPFQPKFLQLCLKSGVKELLPPFEPPNLIKNCPISVTPQPDSAVTDALHEKRELSSSKDIDKVTKNLQSVIIKDKKKRKQGVRKVKGPSELPESKCKLVVKLSSSVPVTGRAEELASNNSAAIDQMTSKICPVCKTFSSSSNTTLNAHIDQCLSNDSGTKQFESDVLKPRIKPRKKKLMVEIYSTALEYTLEDLDRRNGTNWAATAVAVDPSEVSVKPMKPKEHENTRKLVVESRGKDREGAVYVDSNGIKIRILSEPNDVPSSSVMVSREDNKKGKVRFVKQKGIETRNMEKKKLVLERKKLKKFKISKTQLTTDEDGSRKVNEDEMEGASTHLDRLLEKSKDPIIWKSTASPLGKWVCARRGIRMKRKNKSPDKIIQCLASILEDSPSTSSQITKYSNSKFAHSTLQPKMPKPLVGICGEALSENVSTSIRFSSGPSAEPRSTPSLSRKFQKQQSILKSAKKGRQAPCSYGLFGESTEVPARENIHGNKRLKLTPDDELHEVFSPELEETRENTEAQDGTSPVDDTELDVEATTSNHHFIEHVNSPNGEPINLENASWLQEEYGAGRSDYDDDNNDALDDEDDNEGNNDVNVGDGVEGVEGVEDDFADESSDETSCDTPQDDSSLTSDGEDEMNLERSLANFQEQSGSPSTASTMSFSTLNGHCHKEPGSYAQPPCPDLVPQAAERPKGEEIMDKPCVCSCRESPSEECKKAPIVTKEKQLPPLYIGPRETGPFNAYRSFSRPDPIVSSGFESPSQSFSTLSQGLVPPSPNPVLRLMGKNLLVVNHEEVATQPPTPSSHCPPAFKPPNCGADPNYSHQNFSSVLTQSQPAANLYQPFLVSERQQRPVSPSSYVPSEVIVIDNPPKIDNMLVPVPVPMQLQGAGIVGPGNPVPQNIAILGAPVMQPSPFFCFPQHNQAGSTGPVLYPRVGPGYITQQVAPPGSHELGSYVQGSFAYRPSSSHVSNPLYYTHTMR